MTEDYRVTKYCPSYDNVLENKTSFMTEYKEHHHSKNVYSIIQKNSDELKTRFIRAYNGKCAYCGTSIKILPMVMFEIDHIIPQTASCFGSSADAGYIENLALACRTCNRNKSDYIPSFDYLKLFHPDYEHIKNMFYRDNLYNIKVSVDAPREASNYYKKLKLFRQTCRLDFLLLNMKGLCERMDDKPELQNELRKAIQLLLEKRNILSD